MNDDELQKLIDEIEAGQQLKVPSYLKREIFEIIQLDEQEGESFKIGIEEILNNEVLDKYKSENYNSTCIQNYKPNYRNERNEQITKYKLKKKIRFIIYSIEVGFVTAAAILFMFIVPFQNLGGLGGFFKISDWQSNGLNELNFNNELDFNNLEFNDIESNNIKSNNFKFYTETKQVISYKLTNFTRKLVNYGSFLMPNEPNTSNISDENVFLKEEILDES